MSGQAKNCCISSTLLNTEKTDLKNISQSQDNATAVVYSNRASQPSESIGNVKVLIKILVVVLTKV